MVGRRGRYWRPNINQSSNSSISDISAISATYLFPCRSRTSRTHPRRPSYDPLRYGPNQGSFVQTPTRALSQHHRPGTESRLFSRSPLRPCCHQRPRPRPRPRRPLPPCPRPCPSPPPRPHHGCPASTFGDRSPKSPNREGPTAPLPSPHLIPTRQVALRVEDRVGVGVGSESGSG